MKVLPIVFFVSLILCVWSGMHLLVYFRLVKLFTFGPRVRLLLKITRVPRPYEWITSASTTS